MNRQIKLVAVFIGASLGLVFPQSFPLFGSSEENTSKLNNQVAITTNDQSVFSLQNNPKQHLALDLSENNERIALIDVASQSLPTIDAVGYSKTTNGGQVVLASTQSKRASIAEVLNQDFLPSASLNNASSIDVQNSTQKETELGTSTVGTTADVTGSQGKKGQQEEASSPETTSTSKEILPEGSGEVVNEKKQASDDSKPPAPKKPAEKKPVPKKPVEKKPPAPPKQKPVETKPAKKLPNNLCRLAYKYNNWPTDIAYAVCMAESNARPKAVNDSDKHNGCRGSYGLFQIACIHDDTTKLLDPEYNVDVANRIWRGRKNFKPWGAYKNGSYKKFLPK